MRCDKIELTNTKDLFVTTINRKGRIAMQKEVFDSKLDELDEKGIYEAFGVPGNEEIALNDSYFELYQLLGEEAMLKLYKHYRGDKIDCPMKLYRAEYIADLAEKATDRRERAQIVRDGGYALRFIDSLNQKRRKESNNSDSDSK